MKRTLVFVFLCSFIAMSLGVCGICSAAGPESPQYIAQKATATPAATPATATSVTGPVKGSPTGKTFVIGAKGGPVTVDATKAKVRDKTGKFVSFSVIKGGLMVTAKGTMKAKTLVATDITVFPTGKSK
jgi:hypothetical protein